MDVDQEPSEVILDKEGETADIEENEEVIDSDESSDESTGDAEEAKLAARANELENQIQENPYLYEAYKELITIYKTQGELDQLRDARQRFSTNFPLTEELWMDWINDEKELVDGVEDRQKVIDLFEKAVQDYLSIPLWMEYCTYAIGLGDTNRCREIMTRATEVGGHHLADGKLLWDLRIEYERMVPHVEKPSAVSEDKTNTLDDEKDRYMNAIYRQMVTLPLVGVDTALVEYKEAFLSTVVHGDRPGYQVTPELLESHKQALEIVNSCNRYENELATAQTPESKLKVYETYISSYVTHHPNLTSCIRCLFERALAVHCLDQNLWIKYTSYLEKSFKNDPDVCLRTYRRSLRNCPWSGSLWSAYCLASEKQGAELKELEGFMETALESGLQTATDFLSVWTTLCDVIRRKIDWANIDNILLDKLRGVFERAIPHLLKYYGEEGDGECLLPRYWALIEAKHCKNMEKAREIWNDTMTGWRHNKAAAWLDFALFERSYGDYKHCRRVFQRALKAVTDWPESICAEYLRFEREEGTLDQLYVAQARVSEVREKLAAEAKDRKPRFDNKKPYGEKKTFKPKERKPREEKPHEKKTQEQKIVTGANSSPVVTVYKRKRDQPLTDNKTQSQAEGGEFKPPLKKHKPTEGGEGSTTLVSTSDNGSAASTVVVPDYSATDNTTVFVSNLSYDATDAVLRDLFTPCGEIKDIRIMKSKGDKSKGFAYVEFTAVESVAPALQLDRTAIRKRLMYVSPCNRNRENIPKIKFDTSLDICKLFVSGLSYDITKEQIEAKFSKHGKLKDVRIVTYKGGKSKGLAYVEFFSGADARKALLALDDTTIDESTIKVEISNPPARRPVIAGERVLPPTLGGTSRETIESLPRGGPRTQLSLFPRVVRTGPSGNALSTSTTKATDSDATGGKNSTDSAADVSPRKPMSNNDFRAMLLSKKS